MLWVKKELVEKIVARKESIEYYEEWKFMIEMADRMSSEEHEMELALSYVIATMKNGYVACYYVY